jgi:toxin CptA
MVRANVRPSRLLAVVFTLIHSATAATVLPLDVAIEAKAVLLALVIASLVHTLYRHALQRSDRSIIELEIQDRERAAVKTRGAEWRDARILCTSCVTPSVTVLNLRVERSRVAQHVLLVRDNVDAADFRRIRVLLRWARPKTPEPQTSPGTSRG